MDLLAELVSWLELGVGGWRYLLSPAFRQRTHDRWRHEPWPWIAWDVFWGVVGLVVTAALAYVAYLVVAG